MDTRHRSVTFEMYALNSIEMDFWSRIPAGFDLPRLDGLKYFFLFGSTASCGFSTVKQFVRPVGRDEHGSGLDRTGSGLKPIFGGSGLVRTAIFLKIGGSGLDRIQKIFLVSM